MKIDSGGAELFHADRRSDGRTNGRTNERKNGRTDERTDGRTDGRTEERTNGRTDERTDGRTHRWTDIHYKANSHFSQFRKRIKSELDLKKAAREFLYIPQKSTNDNVV